MKKIIIDSNKLKKKDLKGDLKKKFKIELLKKFMLIVGLKSLNNQIILFDKLTDPKIVTKLRKEVNNLKKVYQSDKLTSLHKNAKTKQKFPGINIFRQILKENGFKMVPRVQSMGYNGSQKIVKRSYLIQKIG